MPRGAWEDEGPRREALRMRTRLRRVADRLETGATAPISTLWVLARCLVASDFADWRLWLLEQSVCLWRNGESISAVQSDVDKGAWYTRAIDAVRHELACGDGAPAAALVQEIEALFPGLVAPRSCRGARHRRVADADLLLIEDVCRDIAETQSEQMLDRRAQRLVRGFCIENDNLRWLLTTRSAPRLRMLAQWCAGRGFAREAAEVHGFIADPLAKIAAGPWPFGKKQAETLIWLIALPDDPRAWHYGHSSRLVDAMGHLNLLTEGFGFPSWRKCDKDAAQFGGEVSVERWFARLHEAVERCRRDWPRWERIRRWRARRTGVDLLADY